MAVADRVFARGGVARETGAWAWAMQRFTAALLGVFLGVHIWVLHFARPTDAGPITLESVRQKISNPAYLALDLLLLATVIYHGLNGVRTVVLDFGIGEKRQRLVTGILVTIGLVGFAWGLVGLIPLVTGKPLFG